MGIRQWIRQDRVINVSPDVEGEDWLASKVTAVGENSFRIARTKNMAGWFAGSPGRHVRVRVPSSEGLFQFTCAVLAEKGDRESYLELDFPQEVIHLERRAYMRIPVEMEAHYVEIRDGGAGLSFNKSVAYDLSGGGIRLETNRICPQETLIRMKFQLPVGKLQEELILTGRIVRSVRGEGARKAQVGVEFIDISPQQQETLVQYILDLTKDQFAQA